MRKLTWIAVAALLVGCDDGESRVQFGVDGDVATLRPLLEVTSTSGEWSLALTGDEIRTPSHPRLSREFETPGRGTLAVDAVLRRPGEPGLVTGSVELELRDDWVWTVHIVLAGGDPTEGCFGCLGSEAFGLPDELRDQALEQGMLTLRMDGLTKVERGITTLEEVIKETSAR